MEIIDEICKTAFYGVCAIAATAFVVGAFVLAGWLLLFVPRWLIIERGYYVVGVVYTILAWGAAWRATDDTM